MAEKVKVSREVAEAIEKAKEIRSEEVIINMCAKKLFVTELDILNVLSSYFVAQILINGYEIEQTPEEILLERYKQNEINRKKAIAEHNAYNEGYTLGYKIGVNDGLNFSGNEIEGINK